MKIKQNQQKKTNCFTDCAKSTNANTVRNLQNINKVKFIY